MNEKTKEYRKEIAAAFIRSLEENPIEWKNMWSGFSVPLNGHTGRKYSGLNRLWLQYNMREQNIEDPRFYTFKQVQDMGLKVKKGSKAFKVEFWSLYDPETKMKVTPGSLTEEERERVIPVARRYSVFNGSQIEGLSEYVKPVLSDAKPQDVIDTIARNMGVDIVYDGGDEAFYRRSDDNIHLPNPESFKSQEAYNATVLHELAHATGASHRLNRTIGKYFGDQDYAREKLVAEITSCFTQNDLGFSLEAEHFNNHKAYIQNWISVISEKEEALMEAIKDAQSAADYMYDAAELDKVKEAEVAADMSTLEYQEKVRREIAEEAAMYDMTVEEYAENDYMPKSPIVTVIWSESPELEDGQVMTLKRANQLFGKLDAQRVEENQASGNRYYDKTKFRIDYIFDGEAQSYEGRQDFGDGDGTLLEHIEKAQRLELSDEKGGEWYADIFGEEALKDRNEKIQNFLTKVMPFFKEEAGGIDYEKEASQMKRVSYKPKVSFEEFIAKKGYELKDMPREDDYAKVTLGAAEALTKRKASEVSNAAKRIALQTHLSKEYNRLIAEGKTETERIESELDPNNEADRAYIRTELKRKVMEDLQMNNQIEDTVARGKEAEAEEAESQKRNTIYIRINKAFVQKDIESVKEPDKTYNRVTMPKNTIVDGKNIGGYSFYPRFILDDLSIDKVYAIPWQADKEIRLVRGTDEIEVNPAALKESLNESYRNWKAMIREKLSEKELSEEREVSEKKEDLNKKDISVKKSAQVKKENTKKKEVTKKKEKQQEEEIE